MYLYHFKTSQGKVSQGTSLKELIFLSEIPDFHIIVKDDGLGVLDVAKGGDIKHHPFIVVGIASNLEPTFILCFEGTFSLLHTIQSLKAMQYAWKIT